VKRPSRKAAETVEIARNTLAETLQGVPQPTSDRVIRQVGQLLDEEIGRERERCADACRRRSDLWRRTTLSQVPAPEGSEEARARANEARYLADLLASGGDLGEEKPPPDSPPGAGTSSG
jgi:hypothetical protein